MWLINTETLALEEFPGEVPAYVILSHTWADDEVSIQDYKQLDDEIRSRKGYGKVVETCRQARRDGQKYAWVDTCCIDKKSSAELTEAINSMYQWYKAATVCYVFLVDLPLEADCRDDSLAKCRWFTRGWTLQELFAPKSLHFFDKDWNFRGTKASFAQQLHQITRIDPEVLRDSDEIMNRPVSVRMSWASTRQTTRVEDSAYCLVSLLLVGSVSFRIYGLS